MLSRIKEIFSSPILRQWIKYKIIHPNDKGVYVSDTVPAYLNILDFNINENFTGIKHGHYKTRRTIENIKSIIDLSKVSHKKLKQESFQDPENFLYYVRFAWIPRYLTLGGPAEFVIDTILEWTQFNIPLIDNAYTTAERISNWSLFLSQRSVSISGPNLAKIKEAIRIDAENILNNLEYYGEDLTGNHLLNNGRGLLWAASIIGSRNLAQMGKDIVENEINRIFDDSGMLREGSSHYQYLVSRNVFESFLCLEQFFNENELIKIKEKLKLIANSCLFFKQGDSFPLFGDISPDESPEWFIHVPNVILDYLDSKEAISGTESKGWASLFTEIISQQNYLKDQESHFYLRKNNNESDLYLHINQEGAPILPGHSHCDTGAPVWFHKGEEVLLDVGRKDYTSESDQYLSSYAHNSVIIDEYEPEEKRRGIFGPKFLEWRFGGQAEILENKDQSVKIKLFSYTYKKIELVREYIVGQNDLTLNIDVLGSGRHTIELPFYYNKNVKGLHIRFPKEGETFSNHPKQIKNKCTKYGKSIEIESMIWRAEVDLPWSTSIHLKIEDQR